MTNLKVFLLSFALMFAIGLVAIAQEAPPTEETTEVTEMIALDEDVQPQDLGISEPKLLSDSPFYFLKNWARGIQSFFTFDPVAKAELKLKFTNEELMEAKKLAETKPEVLPKALENYKVETDQLKEATEKIKETVKDPKVDKFMDKFIDNNLKHQKLFGKFEKELPPEVYEKIEMVKDENMAKFSDIGLKFAPPEIFQEKIVKAIEIAPGSNFKHFKNLEVLQGVEEKVPDPAKLAIRQAMENALKRLRGDLEAMAPADREKFKDYIENIGGNETRHLKVMDEFEREEMPEIVREEMEKAKERILERIEGRLKEYEKRQLDIARKEFLDHLTKYGRMEDLRIVKELENNLSPELIDQILAIKRNAEKKLVEAIEKAETPEQQREFFEKIDKKFHDVQQLEVFKEIEDIIPPEKKEFFEKMKEKAMAKMEEEFEKGKKMGLEERGMIFDKLAGSSPEHIKIFKEFGPPPEMMSEIMKETMERLSKRAEFIENPARLEFFKRKIEEEEGIRRRLEENRPEIFKRLEERSGMLLEGLSSERAKEQIEEARQAIDLCESIFATLVPELQKEILERSPYTALMEAAKKHLEKAEAAFAEEYFGQAFGQATAALHNAGNAHRIIDEITMRRSIGEERQKKFEEVFEKVREELKEKIPELIEEIPPEAVPEVEKITRCRIPTIPEKEICVGKWELRKDPQGCPYFHCQVYAEEIPCAKEGEKVNRNPMLGPTHQQCCEGLIEIRVSKSYSICKKELPEEVRECQTDLDCPQPLCPGVKSYCKEGKCIVPMCEQILPFPIKPIELPVKPTEPTKPEVCIQVITPAISPEGICKEFPTPCDVPMGWKKVDRCPKEIVCKTFITCLEGQTSYDTGERDEDGCPILKCKPIEEVPTTEKVPTTETLPE